MKDFRLRTSDFATYIGINPWKSRQRLFRELTGRQERDPINAAMQWGIDNEYRAVAASEAASGILFAETGKNQKNHQITFMGHDMSSTPDGRSGSTGLEVKCPKTLYEEVPAHYMAQVQGQCVVCGFDQVIFGVWTPGKARVWQVPRSEEYIEWMLPFLAEFRDAVIYDKQPGRRKKPVPPEVQTTLIMGEE